MNGVAIYLLQHLEQYNENIQHCQRVNVTDIYQKWCVSVKLNF